MFAVEAEDQSSSSANFPEQPRPPNDGPQKPLLQCVQPCTLDSTLFIIFMPCSTFRNRKEKHNLRNRPVSHGPPLFRMNQALQRWSHRRYPVMRSARRLEAYRPSQFCLFKCDEKRDSQLLGITTTPPKPPDPHKHTYLYPVTFTVAEYTYPSIFPSSQAEQ